MKIDKSDGSVAFGIHEIRPFTEKGTFQASPLGVNATVEATRGPFETLGFIPEPGMMATAEFKNGRLSSISVTFDVQGDSPEGRSMEHELARKKAHDEFLLRELGDPPYIYHWGSVVSEFYHQHCGSELTVSYDADTSG